MANPALRYLLIGLVLAFLRGIVPVGSLNLYGDDYFEDNEEGGEIWEDETHNNYQFRRKDKYVACQDLRDECEEWVAAGECESEPLFVHSHCPRACNVCHNRTRMVPAEEAFSYNPRKTENAKIRSVVGGDVGVPQSIVNWPDQVKQSVKNAEEYVRDIVMKQDRYIKVRDLCWNQNEECAYWAVMGECEKNPEFMDLNCAPMCYTCEKLHANAKCPIDPNQKNAWYRGDLNRMFERITTSPEFKQYTPKVLSRPDYVGDDTEETAEYQLGPWVVILDNFISDEEALRMIDLGAAVGYARSTDVGQVYEDGSFEEVVSKGRTSTNAWCRDDNREEGDDFVPCETDPVTIAITDRIEDLTMIPKNNSEHLQLLRYEVGQFYHIHHDYIEEDIEYAQGVRILTVFLYLNDVEGGGATAFPRLKLTVEPKRGRALLWPSVLDDKPNTWDPRTHHKAMNVTKGIKYAANAWIHQRDNMSPTLAAC